MIKEHEIIWAIEDAIASLPFKPTAKDLAAAVGWLLMDWGKKVVRKENPELDPDNINEIDKHNVLNPSYGTSFIMQGYMMRYGWAPHMEGNDDTDSLNLGSSDSSSDALPKRGAGRSKERLQEDRD